MEGMGFLLVKAGTDEGGIESVGLADIVDGVVGAVGGVLRLILPVRNRL